MIKRFETILMEEAFEFVRKQDLKVRKKILQNFRRAELQMDSKLFKKINGNIWEFRTICYGTQYRFLAFWSTADKKRTLVITTHGFVKKTSKIPKREIEKAERARVNYLKEHTNENI